MERHCEAKASIWWASEHIQGLLAQLDVKKFFKVLDNFLSYLHGCDYRKIGATKTRSQISTIIKTHRIQAKKVFYLLQIDAEKNLFVDEARRLKKINMSKSKDCSIHCLLSILILNRLFCEQKSWWFEKILFFLFSIHTWWRIARWDIFSQQRFEVNSAQCSSLSAADVASFNLALRSAFYYRFYTVANAQWHSWKCNFVLRHRRQWQYSRWDFWNFCRK